MKLHEYSKIAQGFDQSSIALDLTLTIWIFQLMDIADHTDICRLDKSNRRLIWLSRHDYSLALFIVIASFGITPLSSLFFPVFVLIYLLISFERPDDNTERSIRKNVNLKKRIFLRKSLSSDPWIFSIPFYSVLFAPKHFFEKASQAEIDAVLGHELIHHKRHDGALLVWFIATSALLFFGASLNIFSLVTKSKELYNTVNTGHDISKADTFFWITVAIVFVSGLPLILSKSKLLFLNPNLKKVLTEMLIYAGGGAFSQWLLREYGYLSDMAAPLDSQASVEQLYQTSWFWTIAMVALFALAILTAFKVVHRTEFIADNLAAQQNYDGIFSRLNKGLDSKIKYHSTSKLAELVNTFTHPSGPKRAKMLSDNPEGHKVHDLGYALIWSFSAGLCILFAYFDGYSSWGKWAVILADVAALCGCIIFFQYCAISISDFLNTKHRYGFLSSLVLTIIYILGASSSIALVFFVDYSVYPQESISLLEYIRFGITTVVVALLLILTSCLTLSLIRGKTELVRIPALLAGPMGLICATALLPDSVLGSNPVLAVLLMLGLSLLFVTLLCMLMVGALVLLKKLRSYLSVWFTKRNNF